jgi:hypothetical protein
VRRRRSMSLGSGSGRMPCKVATDFRGLLELTIIGLLNAIFQRTGHWRKVGDGAQTYRFYAAKPLKSLALPRGLEARGIYRARAGSGSWAGIATIFDGDSLEPLQRPNRRPALMPENISGRACYHFATQLGSTRQNEAGRGDTAAPNGADNSVLRDTRWYRTIQG